MGAVECGLELGGSERSEKVCLWLLAPIQDQQHVHTVAGSLQVVDSNVSEYWSS